MEELQQKIACWFQIKLHPDILWLTTYICCLIHQILSAFWVSNIMVDNNDSVLNKAPFVSKKLTVWSRACLSIITLYLLFKWIHINSALWHLCNLQLVQQASIALFILNHFLIENQNCIYLACTHVYSMCNCGMAKSSYCITSHTYVFVVRTLWI